MKNRIVNTLVRIGIPVGNLGFKYITDALLLLNDGKHENPQWTLLYAEIAELNNTTQSRVERAIRHNFEVARDLKTDYQIVEHYIGFVNTQNSNTLALLNLRIKQEMEEEDE